MLELQRALEFDREGDWKTGTAEGIDQVAAVYRNARWWLCDSKFDAKDSVGSLRFLQLLTR